MLAFSIAHIEKADSDGVAVHDGLTDACKAKREPVKIEFRFDAGVDANFEVLVGAQTAPALAEIENASGHGDGAANEGQVNPGVDLMPLMCATIVGDIGSNRGLFRGRLGD